MTLMFAFLSAGGDHEARLEVARAHGAGEIDDHVLKSYVAPQSLPASFPPSLPFSPPSLGAGAAFRRSRPGGPRAFLETGHQDELGHRKTRRGASTMARMAGSQALRADGPAEAAAVSTGAARGLVGRGRRFLAFLRFGFAFGGHGTGGSVATQRVFRLTTSSRTVSDTVMRREPAWKLRWAVMRSEELLRQVDVRLLERAGLDVAEAAGARVVAAGEDAAANRARRREAGVEVVALAHERGRVVEVLSWTRFVVAEVPSE